MKGKAGRGLLEWPVLGLPSLALVACGPRGGAAPSADERTLASSESERTAIIERTAAAGSEPRLGAWARL